VSGFHRVEGSIIAKPDLHEAESDQGLSPAGDGAQDDPMSPLLTAKRLALQVWKPAAHQFGRGRQWLSLRQQAAFFAAGFGVVLLLLIFSGVTAAVAAIAAWIALMRHFAQTDADRQRRITESFSKAVEQLAHDKIEVHLGGIYTLERISRESLNDYWTVMETLCAFVRERARWKTVEAASSKTAGAIEHRNGLPTDIAAVLAVIVRRDSTSRQREREMRWSLDLRETDLRGADLLGADLQRANLSGTHLDDAILRGAHLEDGILRAAHLEGASLKGVHLNDAQLQDAHLQSAILINARLEGASLRGARLEGAYLAGAHLERAGFGGAHLKGAQLQNTHLKDATFEGAQLEGVDLRGAIDLEGVDLSKATGDVKTRLPDNVPRPDHWSPCEP
jgi:uncharacterized protein YjbI with pentapeptide repeats